jgi:transposase
MYNSGFALKEAEDQEGLTPDAVYGIMKRYRHQNEAKDNTRSGRPQALTD